MVAAPRGAVADRRALPVVGLGLLVAVAPVALGPVLGGGPLPVAVRVLQAVGVAVGLAVTGAGYRSYRTGDLRPAVAVGAATGGVALLAVLAVVVAVAVGPVVPVWAWVLGASLVVGFAAAWAYRPPPDAPPRDGW